MTIGTDKEDIRFTEAWRPRLDQEKSICSKCNNRYPGAFKLSGAEIDDEPSDSTPNTQQQAHDDDQELENQKVNVELSPHSIQLEEPEFEQLGSSMTEGGEGEGTGEVGELEELGEDGE
jgi:hypothetical protein